MPTKTTKETQYQYLVRTVKAHQSDDCLIWPFLKVWGYGHVKLPGDRVPKRVNREAYRISRGSYPVRDACHTCDTPACYNSRHLFDGTEKENLADMSQKGRSLSGTRNYFAKYTDDAVLSMRDDFATGLTVKQIADRHGVPVSTAKKIVYRMTWRHI